MIGDTRDFGIGRRVCPQNWNALRAVGESANRLCDAQAQDARPAPDVVTVAEVTRPSKTPDGLHAPALCFGDPRVMALLTILVGFSHLLAGFRNRQLVELVATYFPLGHSPGGFRTWWRRLHEGSDEELDNAHLMRMAGRFARRVRGWAQANGIPVIDCSRGQRKHEIAAEYLASHRVELGVFLVLVARAQTRVWQVERGSSGSIRNLSQKPAYVHHYSFHILDPEWGHLTIKMAGHPPFDAQVILNGHEYVAGQARERAIEFVKEDNCFTKIANAADLARVADTLSGVRTIGRLTRVCEQRRSGFSYEYSVYQAEYSRNLLFRMGGQMDQVFERMVDRTPASLDVPRLRTLFGAKQRPRRTRRSRHRVEVVVERPVYALTLFKLHFGNLTLKAYTKGERVLRFEAIAHSTKELHCGRRLDRFPEIVGRLKGMLE